MRPARDHDVFDAVAHPVRRRLLTLLQGGAMPSGELARKFDISLPGVAQHLKVLRDAELIQQQREGRQVIYTLNPEPLKALYEWLEGFGAHWNRKLDALEQHLDRKHRAPKRRSGRTTARRS